jgi:alkanesulfonate monooxygenase SsuD/methylene tetrahydromethanopterin reductase-like flavin-dependent oxidoreductase (luciferase family)
LQLVISYDMRAPSFGAPALELYAAALDQAAWADALGFDVVGLGEHHASPDGYNPSPLVLAAAMGARTKRILLRTSVALAPLYDPVKLIEDAAVTQLATGGRLLLGIGGGYRPAEFEMFGKRLKDRWRAIGEFFELARLAWRGEPFLWQGRRMHITPVPDPPPPLLLGGGSAAAARRSTRASGSPIATSARSSASPTPGRIRSRAPFSCGCRRSPRRTGSACSPTPSTSCAATASGQSRLTAVPRARTPAASPPTA